MTAPLPEAKAAGADPKAAPASTTAKPHTGFGHALHHAVHHHHHYEHHRHHAPHAVTISPQVKAAVDEAIKEEHVPSAWRSSLLFIAAQESSGQVGAKNSTDSARGLFQLTRANWHLNPNGGASFGDARQEAQGGIRYIQARYDTAPKAESFWRSHHWY